MTPRLLACVCLLASGCADPVLAAEIDALGGETNGVRHGPMHRPGQPCLLCHSSEGGRSPSFSVAGTLYQKPNGDIPVQGATIHLTDATGATYDLTSNCVGTFYVEEQKWAPTFPLVVDISYPQGGLTNKMKSKIGREGSCAKCHAIPAGVDSPGRVYLEKDLTAPDFARPALDCGNMR
jgi:hypothetical protein